MSESTQASLSAEVLAEVDAVPEEPARRVPFLDRTPVAFTLFLGVGLGFFIAAGR